MTDSLQQEIDQRTVFAERWFKRIGQEVTILQSQGNNAPENDLLKKAKQNIVAQVLRMDTERSAEIVLAWDMEAACPEGKFLSHCGLGG